MVEFALFCFLLFAGAWAITAPLRSPPRDDDDAEVRALEATRDAKLREIREAELDLHTGKLSVDDHARVDRALRAEALALLQRLDAARRPEDAREDR